MLTADIERFVEARRAAGFRFAGPAWLLRSYGRFAEARGDQLVKSESVIAWAALTPHPGQRVRRLLTVRLLARFLRAEDSRHEVPPEGVFCAPTSRKPPYILSDREILRLIAAARELNPRESIRPWAYATLFGLLATTGMRISEALALRFTDVTVDGLVVRETKFRKSRLLPLAESTWTVLHEHETGLRPSRSELGQVLSSHFAEDRERIRAKIQERLASPEGLTASRELETIGLRTLDSSSGETVLPHLGIDLASSTTGSGTARAHSMAGSAGSRSKRPLVFGAIGVAIGVAGLLAFLALTRSPASKRDEAAAIASHDQSTVTEQAARFPVEIVTEPAGAIIMWNGQPLGLGPLQTQLPPGLHTLVVSYPGHFSQNVSVTVVPDTEVPVKQTVTLVKEAAPDTGAHEESVPTKPPRSSRGSAVAKSTPPAETAKGRPSAEAVPKSTAPKVRSIDDATTNEPQYNLIK